MPLELAVAFILRFTIGTPDGAADDFPQTSLPQNLLQVASIKDGNDI
jgi:hypothetical protein